MTGMLDNSSDLAADVDLVEAVHRILEQSAEPMTVAKIRAALPRFLRDTPALPETLARQVAARVIVLYPRYRSPHERYWTHPMKVHIETLVRGLLQQGPLPHGEILRRLPDYARSQADALLDELQAKAKLFFHPPAAPRRGPRLGLEPPDPRPYLKPELSTMFQRLQTLGFSARQLREAAFELLREAEWTETPKPFLVTGELPCVTAPGSSS